MTHRPRLLGLAYRMTGSVADAEDILQEAYLRWQAADRSDVVSTGAFLARIVTRLCLDYLKSARVQRETYVGPWLPEPLAEEWVAAPAEGNLDLSVALMLAMERLSPLERAVFLLHDVFEMGFAELADILERSEAACRQLAVRARDQVQHARQRFTVPPARTTELVAAFMLAARQGEVSALQELLAEDVGFHADGGGKRSAALNVIVGREKVIRLFEGVARKRGDFVPHSRMALLWGSPGYLTIEPDGILQATAFKIEDDRIAGIYVMRNPDKLAHLSGWAASLTE